MLSQTTLNCKNYKEIREESNKLLNVLKQYIPKIKNKFIIENPLLEIDESYLKSSIISNINLVKKNFNKLIIKNQTIYDEYIILINNTTNCLITLNDDIEKLSTHKMLFQKCIELWGIDESITNNNQHPMYKYRQEINNILNELEGTIEEFNEIIKICEDNYLILKEN